MLKRIKYSIAVLTMLSVTACSNPIKKLDIEYKEDFSGSIRALISVQNLEKETDEFYKLAKPCGFTLQEVYGDSKNNDKTLIADYKFESHKQLERSVDCSEKIQETVAFNPVKIVDNPLSKDITFSISFKDYSYSGDFLDYSKIPPEIIVSVPGKILDVSISSLNYPSEDWYTFRHDIAGYNTVKFYIQKISGLNIADRKISKDCAEHRDEKNDPDNTELAFCLLKSMHLSYPDRYTAKQCIAPSDLADKATKVNFFKCVVISQNSTFVHKYNLPCNAKAETETDIKKFDECFKEERKRIYTGNNKYPRFTLNITTRVSKIIK